MVTFFHPAHIRGSLFVLAFILLLLPGIRAQDLNEKYAPVLPENDLYHLDGMGFKVGLGIVNFTDEFKFYDLDTIANTATKRGNYDYESRNTIVLGFFMTAPLYKNIAVQPEILYTSRGAKVERNDVSLNGTLEYRLQYLEFPVLLRASFPTGSKLRPYLLVGPSMAVNIYAKSEFSGDTYNDETEEWETIDTKTDIDANYKGVDWGLVLGAGVDHRMGTGKIFFEARYIIGLSVVASYSDDFLPEGMDTPNERNAAINILAGYSFF